MSALTLLFLGQTPPIPRPLLGDGLLGGLALTGTVVGILFIALLGGGVTILVRRARAGSPLAPGAAGRIDASAAGQPGGSATAANVALVRLDDAIAAGADELGFAIAQFGEERAARFDEALGAARRDLATAFALKQKLDDSTPDSATQVREWNARILALCTAAGDRLDAERAAFDRLRRVERDSSTRLHLLRRQLGDARLRLAPSAQTLASLAEAYSPAALEPIAQAPDEAEQLIGQAAQRADAAGSSLDASGVNPVSSILDAAERDARRAARSCRAARRGSDSLLRPTGRAAAHRTRHGAGCARSSECGIRPGDRDLDRRRGGATRSSRRRTATRWAPGSGCLHRPARSRARHPGRSGSRGPNGRRPARTCPGRARRGPTDGPEPDRDDDRLHRRPSWNDRR